MKARGRVKLAVVPDDQQQLGLSVGEELMLLIAARDEAEATIRRCDGLIRPLARQWADERKQFTMPSIDQLRRELCQ